MTEILIAIGASAIVVAIISTIIAVSSSMLSSKISRAEERLRDMAKAKEEAAHD